MINTEVAFSSMYTPLKIASSVSSLISKPGRIVAARRAQTLVEGTNIRSAVNQIDKRSGTTLSMKTAVTERTRKIPKRTCSVLDTPLPLKSSNLLTAGHDEHATLAASKARQIEDRACHLDCRGNSGRCISSKRDLFRGIVRTSPNENRKKSPQKIKQNKKGPDSKLRPTKGANKCATSMSLAR